MNTELLEALTILEKEKEIRNLRNHSLPCGSGGIDIRMLFSGAEEVQRTRRRTGKA